MLVLPAVAAAETYEVDTLEDATHFEGCVYISGCSLRDAIERADEHEGEDTIEFGVTGTIELGSEPLPGITDPVLIDATTVTGYADKPLVAIDGANTLAEGSREGLFVSFGGGGSRIEGLAIGGFDIGIDFAGGTSSRLCASYVGVGLDGTTAFPNGVGVEIGFHAPGNRIGAECPGPGNLISGNESYGLIDFGSGSVISNNGIGVDALGDPLGNGGPTSIGAGILVTQFAEGPFIGATFGEVEDPGNAIAYNEGTGIKVEDAASEVEIRRNRIFANSELGIQVLSGTTTPMPQLESVAAVGSELEIAWSFVGPPQAEIYFLDLFANESCDPSGSGEGQFFLGTVAIEADGEGGMTLLSSELELPPAEAEIFSATMSGAAGGTTSQFSECFNEAPQAQIETTPANPSESEAAIFTFSGFDPAGTVAGFECQLDGAGFAPCSSPQEYTSVGQGAHRFEVLAVDKAGKAGSPDSYEWVVQLPPAAPVLTATEPASPGNDLTPLVFGSAEAGLAVAIYTEADCQGDPITFVTAEELEAGVEVSVAADAVTEFSAEAYAGEEGSECSEPLTYVEDSTAPEAEIIDPKPTDPTSSQTAEFNFSSVDLDVAEFECSLDGATFATCTSPATYGPLMAGPHKFEVRAIDEAGNVGAPALFNWTIETTPPAVVIDSVSKALLAEGESSELKFHANRNGAFTLRLNAPDCGVESGEILESGSYSGSPAEQGVAVAAADLDGGANALRLCLTDDLDLTGSATTTISKDSIAPETQIDPPKPSDPTASTNAELNFSGTDSGSGIAGFECSLDDAEFGSCATPTFYTSLANGLHRFEVRAIDEAGNVDPTPASYEWTIDTTLPTVTIDSLSKPVLGEGESAELRFHADRNGDFVLFSNAGSCGSESGVILETGTYANSPAEASIAVAAADLEEGANELLLCLTSDVDATGSATTSIDKDSAPPTTAIDSTPANPSISATATFAFSGSDPGGSGVAGFQCRLDAAGFEPCASPRSFTSLAVGAHRFEVRAVDKAGNVDPTPATFDWTIATPPPAAAKASLVPVNGETLVVAPREGKVLIQLPGEKGFHELDELETIPVGAVVDATNGKVRLTSVDAHGNEQTAYFFGGIFRVTQRDGSGLTTLRLEGGNPNSCGGVTRGHAIPAHPGGIPCSCASASSSLASASRGGRGRHLWGSGHGNFRTEGSYGSATVRGTIWFVEDICGGTFFKVKRGIVSVRDFPHSRTISLPAGKTYLAQP